MRQICWAEGLRQHFAHGQHSFRSVHQQVWSAVLIKQLAAAATRHQQLAQLVAAAEGDQSTTSGGDQVRDQSAFSAQTQPVGGVLDIAATDNAPIIDQGRSTDRELRIGRVGVLGELPSTAT